jgi:hypothetical protein
MSVSKDGIAEWSEEEHQVAFFRWVDERISNGNTHYITIGAIPNGHGQVEGVALLFK